jgi:hypothetical protein
MRRAGNVVAWTCIFSSLFVGCYSSAMIDPTGEDKERAYLGEICYLVRNDSTKYWFEKPPALVNDSIVGVASFYRSRVRNTERVSIPLSEVTMACVNEPDPLATTVLVVAIAGTVAVAIATTWHNSDTTIPFPPLPSYPLY